MHSMNREKKLKLNIITTIIYQIVNIVSGFILPNFFLRYYGSEVNGLISSITQFLAVISLCECGVGAVIQAALYRPIAEKDEHEISRIYKSSTNFFNKIAALLICYMLVLMFVFPLIVNKSFSALYTGVLIFAITINMLAQYYFAITYKLILNAAQLSYIQMTISTVTIILNVVTSIILMRFGANIQIVKLASSVLFLVQPLVYKCAVNKVFEIDDKVVLNGEPIKQKWNGLAQHIATVVLENTDVLVLTVFSTLSNVSIYAVYHLVTNGIKLMFTSVANSMKSLLGDMYAREEKELLDMTFSRFEWIIHESVTLIYSVAAILIVPFVKVYTRNVNDANYILPMFGVLMTFAMAIYTIRLPYSQMIQAAGHFKQTQTSAVIEAVLNLSISIVVVFKFGLIGVAIGTIIAVFYRTIYFVCYLSKNILKRNILIFIKQVFYDAVTVLLIYLTTSWIHLGEESYFSWIIMAIKVGGISFLDMLAIGFLFTRPYMLWMFRLIRKKK